MTSRYLSLLLAGLVGTNLAACLEFHAKELDVHMLPSDEAQEPEDSESFPEKKDEEPAELDPAIKEEASV